MYDPQSTYEPSEYCPQDQDNDFLAYKQSQQPASRTHRDQNINHYPTQTLDIIPCPYTAPDMNHASSRQHELSQRQSPSASLPLRKSRFS
jgi:hypothetical protein